MSPQTSVTPIVPEVGFIGQGDVYLSPSASIPGKVHIVIHVGTTWACSCPATGECMHLRRARKIEGGL